MLNIHQHMFSGINSGGMTITRVPFYASDKYTNGMRVEMLGCV